MDDKVYLFWPTVGKKSNWKSLGKVVGVAEWEVQIPVWRELKYSVIYEGLIEGKKQCFLKQNQIHLQKCTPPSIHHFPSTCISLGLSFFFSCFFRVTSNLGLSFKLLFFFLFNFLLRYQSVSLFSETVYLPWKLNS